METNVLLLTAVALLPAIVLCIYIFKKDRVEKEPIGLLAILFICGALTCIPAGEIEGILKPQLHSLFAWTFIGIALVEEGLKWLAMWIVTNKNKNFNSLFDGIVYAVFVSLGFAAFENVLYSLNFGWNTALLRMVTAVPAHTFFAIIMGYYYSNWHIYSLAGKQEKEYVREGRIQEPKNWISGKRFLLLSVVMPTATHGFYDYCCMSENAWFAICFLVFLVFLYIYCFGKVKKMSKADNKDTYISYSIVLKKHLQLICSYEENVDEEGV